jgi:hypothetical protein
MSVSSHLNPEPERRLWVIHEKLRRSAERTEFKLWALAALAVLELGLSALLGDAYGLPYALRLLLGGVLPLCLFALSPLVENPAKVPLADPPGERARREDSLLSARDLALYPQMELVIVLDKYLGGGITATQYYEDIVGLIVKSARVGVRKARLFKAASVIALAAQLLLLAALACR